jgi:hypothetical protein
METKNGVRKEVVVSALEVTKVYKSDYQKEGTLTAELRQVTTTLSYYPTKSIVNSLNDNIFGMTDFGFKESAPYESKETRVAWIDVPENSTVESVQNQLKNFPESTLYKMLSNFPIVTEEEQYAIDNPDLDVSLDTFAKRQVVRHSQSSETPGMLALVNGKVQYRRIAFSKTKVEDIDTRTNDPVDFYATPQITAELNNIVFIPEGQAL